MSVPLFIIIFKIFIQIQKNFKPGDSKKHIILNTREIERELIFYS